MISSKASSRSFSPLTTADILLIVDVVPVYAAESPAAYKPDEFAVLITFSLTLAFFRLSIISLALSPSSTICSDTSEDERPLSLPRRSISS